MRNGRALRLLNLRRVREQPVRTLLAVVAVGAGTALSVGVVIARDSVDRSSAGFSTALSGAATLRVESQVDHGALDESVLPAIRAVPGVKAAVPLVVTVTTATDERGTSILLPAVGVDCSIQAALGSFACDDAQLAGLGDQPLMAPSLAARLGDGGAIHSDVGTTLLDGAPTLASLDAINDGHILVYDLATAQRLFGRPSGYDTALIVPEPGTDASVLRRDLEAATGPQHRVVDVSAPLSSSTVAAILLPFLFLFSLLGLAIGGQVVHSSIELSLEERRREMATAAALGQPPRAQLLGIVAESVLVGVAGGLVGVAGGIVIARAFVANLSTQISRSSGLRLDIRVTPAVVAIGILISVLLCVAASIGPARRASKADLVAELSGRRQHALELAVRRSRILLMLGFAVVGTVLAWFGHRDGSIEPWQPNAVIVGTLVVTIISIRLPAKLAPLVLRPLRRLRGFRSGPARMALDNLVTSPRRTSSILIAVTAPIAMAVTLGSVVPAIGSAARDLARTTAEGRVFASTLATNNSAAIDSKIPPQLEAQIVALPGVAAVEHLRFAAVDDPRSGRIELSSTDGAPPPHHVYQGSSAAASLARGDVMVGPRLASKLDVRPGDSFSIPGRYGMVTLKVGGIWASPSGVGLSIQTTNEQLLAISGPRPTDRLNLIPKVGITPAELARQVRDTQLDPRLIALPPDELGADYSREFQSFLSPFWALQRGTLVVALVATMSTLLLTGIQRRREQGMLAAVGMPPSDLARMTLVEAGLLGLTATVLGGVVAQLTLLCVTWASSTAVGLGLPFRPQLGVVLVAGAAATLVTLVGAALPAYRTSRLDPALALRDQ